MDESTYMVNVLCMTYNQASFIEDAFNAFTMQQTTFPFVCTIIDDASNDGEQNVIKTYLKEHFDPVDQSTISPSDTPDYHFLFARHKTHPNCYFAVYFLNYNHFGTAVLQQRKLRYAAEWFEKSKYIAFCEGDDFWTDPRKLEKQVDFLEYNPDHVICSHDYMEYSEELQIMSLSSYHDAYLKKKLKNGASYFDYSLNNYFEHWLTQPLTCMIRKKDFFRSIPVYRYPHFRDDIFFYYVVKQGKGALLKDVMGVYRMNAGGIWASKTEVEKKKGVRDNAYNIYLVERDERAFQKMNAQEKFILYQHLHSRDFKQFMKELREYRRMVPLKCFLLLMLSVSKMIVSYIPPFLISKISKA